MTFETVFRISFAIIAIGLAGLLGAMLITGRSRTYGVSAERRSEPAAYWGTVGMTAITAATLAIAAMLPSERHVLLPLIFLGFLGGQLFETLVSGASPPTSGRGYTRAGEPRFYWRGVAFNAALVALAIALFAWDWTRSATP